MESTHIDLSTRVDIKLPVQEGGLLARRLLLSALVVLVACVGSTANPLNFTITTRSYDNARTGWNRNETSLNLSNVTPSTFHKVGELRVDDKIEASPLYVASVNTNSGTRDLV